MLIHSIGKRIKDFLYVKVLGVPEKRQEIIMEDHMPEVKKEESRVEKWFYKSGGIKAECYYVKDKLEGISCYYYESGHIQAKENYKDGNLDGLTKRYHENGNIKFEEYYHGGKLVKRLEYDQNGHLLN